MSGPAELGRVQGHHPISAPRTKKLPRAPASVSQGHFPNPIHVELCSDLHKAWRRLQMNQTFQVDHFRPLNAGHKDLFEFNGIKVLLKNLLKKFYILLK